MLSAAPVTHRLPPRFLWTNQTGNSLPLPGTPVVTAAFRNNHGPAIRILERMPSAFRRPWGSFCVPKQGVPVPRSSLCPRSQLGWPRAGNWGSAQASASLPPSTFQMTCWSPSTTTRPSSCPAGASKWTWRWRRWTTTSTGTSFTSATFSGACGAKAPTPVRDQAQHPQR